MPLSLRADFTVPGKPVSWERAGNAKNGRKYTPEKTRTQQEKVSWMYSLASTPRASFADEFYKGRFAIVVESYVPDLRARDVDNLGKLVMDALNKMAYNDDSQVWDLHSVKFLDKDNPRTRVLLYLIMED